MQINLRHVSYYCRRLFNQKPEPVPRVDSVGDTGIRRQDLGRAIAKAKKQSVLPHRSIYVVRIQNLPYLAAKVGRSYIINKPHSLSCCQRVFERMHPLPCLFIFVMYVTLKVLHPLFRETPSSFIH